MDLKQKLLFLIIKLILLIMFFQIFTLVAGLILGSLVNEIDETFGFAYQQAFTASSVATASMILVTFIVAWVAYKYNISNKVATVIAAIPVFLLWMGTLFLVR